MTVISNNSVERISNDFYSDVTRYSLQPIGYVVPYNIAAKDIDVGATITYTMVPYAPYSNYFNLVTTSQGYAYLSIKQTINYASLVLKSFIISKYRI